MLPAMNNSGFGAGWTLLGRLWCACWRGAKGTSCSHLSWCTAWGRFLSHKFCKISGFGCIGTSFPNLRTCPWTSQRTVVVFFGSESSRFFRSTLGATSSSWRLVLWRQTSQNIIETPRVSLRTPPNSFNIPQKVLNLRSWSDQANSCGQIEPRTLSNFGSQTKIIQEKSIYIFPSPKTTIKLNDS